MLTPWDPHRVKQVLWDDHAFKSPEQLSPAVEDIPMVVLIHGLTFYEARAVFAFKGGSTRKFCGQSKRSIDHAIEALRSEAETGLRS